MPVRFPCTKCQKACKKDPKEGDESICCDKCEKWVHFTCTGLNNEEIECYQNTDEQFICERCRNTCLVCKKYCKSNHKRITCVNCNHIVHEKCRGPDFCLFVTDPVVDFPIFYCNSCSPTFDADETLTPNLDNLENSSTFSSDIDFSDAHTVALILTGSL